MNRNLRRLEIVGITYNQIENNLYAVILREAGGSRRIPIVIGENEAQSIECKLQNIVTPRPLPHDLYINTLNVLGYELQGVVIYRLSTGVFAADIMLYGEGKSVRIDSRSSDAIALALRAGAPIYASAALIDEVGFMASDQKTEKTEVTESCHDASIDPAAAMSVGFDWSQPSDEALSSLLENAIATEYYELAAKIKKEIDRRQGKDK